MLSQSQRQNLDWIRRQARAKGAVCKLSDPNDLWQLLCGHMTPRILQLVRFNSFFFFFFSSRSPSFGWEVANDTRASCYPTWYVMMMVEKRHGRGLRPRPSDAAASLKSIMHEELTYNCLCISCHVLFVFTTDRLFLRLHLSPATVATATDVPSGSLRAHGGRRGGAEQMR